MRWSTRPWDNPKDVFGNSHAARVWAQHGEVVEKPRPPAGLGRRISRDGANARASGASWTNGCVTDFRPSNLWVSEEAKDDLSRAQGIGDRKMWPNKWWKPPPLVAYSNGVIATVLTIA